VLPSTSRIAIPSFATCRFSSTTSTLTASHTPSLFSPPNEAKPFFVTTPIFYVNACGLLVSRLLRVADVQLRISVTSTPWSSRTCLPVLLNYATPSAALSSRLERMSMV